MKTWDALADRFAASARSSAPEDDVSSAEITTAYEQYRRRARGIFGKRRG